MVRLLKSERGEDMPRSTNNVKEEKEKIEKARVVVSVREISCTVCAQAIEKQVKKNERNTRRENCYNAQQSFHRL